MHATPLVEEKENFVEEHAITTTTTTIIESEKLRAAPRIIELA
jgi:hypothetical protein